MSFLLIWPSLYPGYLPIRIKTKSPKGDIREILMKLAFWFRSKYFSYQRNYKSYDMKKVKTAILCCFVDLNLFVLTHNSVRKIIAIIIISDCKRRASS